MSNSNRFLIAVALADSIVPQTHVPLGDPTYDPDRGDVGLARPAVGDELAATLTPKQIDEALLLVKKWGLIQFIELFE